MVRVTDTFHSLAIANHIVDASHTEYSAEERMALPTMPMADPSQNLVSKATQTHLLKSPLYGRREPGTHAVTAMRTISISAERHPMSFT